MKKITLTVALFLTAILQSYAQFPAPYCPVAFSNSTEPITLVNFAGINQTSPNTVGTDQPAHQDFTAVMGAVTANTTYPIILKGNTDGTSFTTYYSVFADWNHDGDFDDVGESYEVGSITASTGLDEKQLEGNIFVPVNAISGNTRFRVVKKFAASVSYPTACNTTGFGQAEDYTLVVTGVNCTPPSVAFETVSQCPDSNFTIAVNVTAMGDATSLSINDDHGGTAQTVSAAGVLTFGPYANGTDVVITAVHSENEICSVSSNPLTVICAPGCATMISPADGALIAPGGVTFTWSAPTTGGEVEGYRLYVGDAADELELLDEYDATTFTTGDDWELNGFNVEVFWQIRPFNAAGEAEGCTAFGLSTEPSPGYCLVAQEGTFPAAAFTPGTCDGTTVNNVATNAWAGEVSVINVVQGQTYAFGSSVATDFATISTDEGDTAIAYGQVPLVWTSTVTGTVLHYLHADDQCTSERVARTRTVVCGEDLSAPAFNSAAIKVFPNPVKNVLNIEFDEPIKDVKVFNLLGQQVVARTINAANSQLDMSALANGNYVVKVASDKGVKTIKVIKE